MAERGGARVSIAEVGVMSDSEVLLGNFESSCVMRRATALSARSQRCRRRVDDQGVKDASLREKGEGDDRQNCPIVRGHGGSL